MRGGFNKIVLMGNITKDIELKHTPSGKAVCKFTLAVNDGKSKDNKAEFISIIAWEKQAENVSKYCGKGSPILLEGKLSNRSYEKDGAKVYFTEVNAYSITFLGTKDSKESNSKQDDQIMMQPEISQPQAPIKEAKDYKFNINVEPAFSNNDIPF
jgi:single-strand DNA-binding protein